MGLAEAIIRIEGKDPHWAQAAQDFVCAVIMWVRLMIPDGSFEDVRALLSLDDKSMQAFVGSDNFAYRGNRYLGMVLAGIQYDWEEIGVKANRFIDINPENKELHSILSTALTQTRWSDSRPIKRDLKGPQFDFSTLKQTPTTVFLILPSRRLVTHSTWLRLVITTILQNIMQDTKTPKVPTLLAIDEYPAIAVGGFPIIENNLPMMRGYGVKPWLLAQDLTQFVACHPQRWESLLGNAGVQQIFATSDVTTSEHFSKMTGQHTVIAASDSTSRNRQAGHPPSRNVSENLGPIPMPLMLPQDFRSMDEGFTVVFSHKARGPVRLYLPYPTELKHMRPIIALDPSS